jgi:hypothetical protein
MGIQLEKSIDNTPYRFVGIIGDCKFYFLRFYDVVNRIAHEATEREKNEKH